MSVEELVEIVQSGGKVDWKNRNTIAFDRLFGAPNGRYPQSARDALSLRAPEMKDDGITFAAYIHPDNPTSGAYSGLSFVIFPINDGPCLVGLGTGTQGLGQDEAILGQPGHARQVQAIAEWLNADYGESEIVAWAKSDPTRTDIKVPDSLQRQWKQYAPIFKRYGGEMYMLFAPNTNRTATADSLTALLDFMMKTRGYDALAPRLRESESIRSKWLSYLLPKTTEAEVVDLLNDRKYVILQGPPGTGKTRLALSLMQSAYQGFGQTIQFHPNTTYETFIGGLSPVQSDEAIGLQFQPSPGALMQAAKVAGEHPEKKYLLHIDEINRADLAKVLGESILLLEPKSDQPRTVNLPYDYGEPIYRKLALPKNLHILGTMNTADRSIALVDVAIRRRFSFVSLWPDVHVVETLGGSKMQKAFNDLLDIFIEFAAEDAFQLLPGHAYFLEQDDERAKVNLRTGLVPLLEEYLAQGYVAGFAEQIRTYLQWVRAR